MIRLAYLPDCFMTYSHRRATSGSTFVARRAGRLAGQQADRPLDAAIPIPTTPLRISFKSGCPTDRELFAPPGVNGIDPGRADCRHPYRHECNTNEYGWCYQKHERIPRLHLKQQTTQ